MTIKRIEFVTRTQIVPPDAFEAEWVRAVALLAEAPTAARAQRLVACTTLRHVPGTNAVHDGISMAWFGDLDALWRFEDWLDGAQGRVAKGATSAVDTGASVLVVAEEVVLRGADWLQKRWSDRVVKLKHMALARRAAGLSPAEFSERWRSRAGRIGAVGQASAISIPDAARGHAYVQNHPVANARTNSRYDAINEVYFDDLDAMRTRIAFFQEHDAARVDADLVGEAAFMAVTEQPISG